jgi:murein DD-endopeptidase MepM/ murein hydrolase activator NlpD
MKAKMTIFFCIGLILALSSLAWAQQSPLSVTAPEVVNEGDPFVISVQASAPCQAVRIEWLGRFLEPAVVFDQGVWRAEVLLGAGLGVEPGVKVVRVEALDQGRPVAAQASVRIAAKRFPEQRLTLPPAMVTPSKENLARIKREQAQVAQALAEVSPARLWQLPFIRPVPGEVTSAFGLRRILNGQPRSPHRGLDMDAARGDDIQAASSGRVLLIGDFYYNGQSVFVDHGQGVVSMYFHMSRVDVSQGQAVAQGQRLGLVGATGRVTGPHLHFGLNILGQSLDPTPLFSAKGGS